ncbi:MAG: hypothetical protein ACTTIC_00250 [Helicobacteraceae bacterium]
MRFLQELKKRGAELHTFDKTRFARIFAPIRAGLSHAKTVQILGTNGKGSTGRFIAQALYARGYDVFHFTSPHIRHARERFWRNGKLLRSKDLDALTTMARTVLDVKAFRQLSYFEFLTLLCALGARECDYLILEAGLGGEFDSTTQLHIDLHVFTSISLDHESVLGGSIGQIALTKFRAVKADFVVAQQADPLVYETAKRIAQERGKCLTFVKDLGLDPEPFTQKGEPQFLAQNRQTAFTALKVLGLDPSVAEVLSTPIFGRLSRFRKNIFLDVGHNVGAARELADFFQGKKVIILFNSYRDKNFFETLKILKPVVKCCFILPIKYQRMAPRGEISAALKAHGIAECDFGGFKKDEIYLVFGSFMCVEFFLRQWKKLER